MKQKSIALLTCILGVFLLISSGVFAETAAPEEAPVWGNPALISSSSPNGAHGPRIAARDNGSQIMITYSKEIAFPNNDPYFSYSTDNGKSWSTPAAIYSSSANSVQPVVAYAGNTAHAAWIERAATESLRTAPRSTWGGTSPQTIATSIFPSDIQDPDIAALGDTIYIVWGQGFPNNIQIRFSRSTNAGTSWTSGIVINPTSTTDASKPDIAIDSSGKAHVVWEQFSAGINTDIMYVQGTPSGGGVTWSTPIKLSTGIDNARAPSITLRGSELQVAFTNFIDIDSQNVLYTSCRSGCTSASKWSNPLNVSGAFVGANATGPTEVLTDIVYEPKSDTSYLFFHGTNPSGDDDEFIYTVNSCDNWSADRQEVTADTINIRSINPSIAEANGTLYLAFQVNNGEDRQIYHMYASTLCTRYLYLPTILK